MGEREAGNSTSNAILCFNLVQNWGEDLLLQVAKSWVKGRPEYTTRSSTDPLHLPNFEFQSADLLLVMPSASYL